MPQVGGHGGDPLHGRCPAGAGIGVAYIQTQTQPGIIHLTDDVRHQLRRLVHDVFQRQHHILRDLRQELPPEGHGLLREPLRKVHQRDIAAVDHQTADAQLPGGGQSLTIAPGRHLPHQRVHGTGSQLRKRGVEPEMVDACHLLPNRRKGGGVVQHGGVAEVRDLQPQSPFPGQLRGVAVHAGEV